MKRKTFITCLIPPVVLFSVSPHGYSLASSFVNLCSGGAALTHADFIIIYTCSRISVTLMKAVVPLMLIFWTVFICKNRLGLKRYLALPLVGLIGILLIDLFLYVLSGTPLNINSLVILSFARVFGIILGGLAIVLLFERKHRYKRNRKTSALSFILLISILIVFNDIPGTVTSAKNQPLPENILANDIYTIFNEKDNRHTKIFDFAGAEITETVRAELAPAFQNGDTEAINAYAHQHIEKIVQTIEDVETVSGGLDISKQQNEIVTQHCVWNVSITPSDSSQTITSNGSYIRYSVHAVIFYNPNTYIISRVADPVRTADITAIGWPFDLHPQIKAEGCSHGPGGGISATFNYWVQIEAYKGPKNAPLATLGYGSYSHSFTVEPD